MLQRAVYNLNIHSIHCHLFVTLEILMYSKSVNIELVECLLFFSVLLSSLSFDFLSFNKFSNTSPLFTHYHGNKYGNKLENRSTLFRAKFSRRYQEEITKLVSIKLILQCKLNINIEYVIFKFLLLIKIFRS